MNLFLRLPFRRPHFYLSINVGPQAEAAKSCFRVVFAAFDLGEFLRVFVRGSKIPAPRHVCCLWTWGVSSGLRQRQQNPASEACLLPLDLGSFFGSSSEATKSCFRGVFAAFGFWEFLRVFVRSNKILLPRHVCCLWTWGASSGQWQRQQKSSTKGELVAFGLNKLQRVSGRGSRNPAPRV